ncbi:MAG: efflux RND transporter periplasmic adaptor subunit [Peptostreptococcaceae bacterium]
MSFKEKIKNKKIKIIVGISVLALIVGGLAISKSIKSKGIEAEGGIDSFIETYYIPENEKIFINGSVIPKQSKEIHLDSGYEISKLNISNGQVVSKGETLFTAKSEEVLSQIDDLNVQLKELYNQKKNTSNNSEEEVDLSSIESEIAKLNSEIKSLKNKSYKTTYAPFSGKVYMNEEESSEESPSYMTIESTDYYMKGQVSEQDLPKIKKDLGVDIYIFATEGKLTGKIASISDRPSTELSGEVNGGGTSSLSYYDVTIDFNSQKGLTNGFHIQASVEIDSKDFKVPTSALKEDESGTYVYRVVDNIIVRQDVKIKDRSEETVVIKSGLAPNDTIIKNPTDEIKEGEEMPMNVGTSLPMEEGK